MLLYHRDHNAYSIPQSIKICKKHMQVSVDSACSIKRQQTGIGAVACQRCPVLQCKKPNAKLIYNLYIIL